MGRIGDLAKSDWNRITTSGGFESDITFTSPDLVNTVDLKGLATKHHLSFDTDGNDVSSKNVHVTVSEALFTDASYPVRDANSEVNLLKHLVEYADSTGVVKKYRVQQNYPDETVGVITCILEDFTD